MIFHYFFHFCDVKIILNDAGISKVLHRVLSMIVVNGREGMNQGNES